MRPPPPLASGAPLRPPGASPRPLPRGPHRHSRQHAVFRAKTQRGPLRWPMGVGRPAPGDATAPAPFGMGCPRTVWSGPSGRARPLFPFGKLSRRPPGGPKRAATGPPPGIGAVWQKSGSPLPRRWAGPSPRGFLGLGGLPPGGFPWGARLSLPGKIPDASVNPVGEEKKHDKKSLFIFR